MVYDTGFRRQLIQPGGAGHRPIDYGVCLIRHCSRTISAERIDAEMRKIFAIAWKDAIIRFASKSQLLFFIVLPIIFTVLLAGGTPSGNEDNRIRLPVVDESGNGHFPTDCD